MKRAVVVLLALLLLATAAMSADQNNWRVLITADDGSGGNASGVYVGVYPTSLEGLDAQDGAPVYADPDPTGTATIVRVVVPGQAELYLKSIKAPTFPYPEKTWDLYVAANWNAQFSMLRLRAFSVNNALPTPAYTNLGVTYPVKYFMRIVDNKGIEGAPANGTMWELPVPTVHSTSAYWNSPINLPMIRLSVGGEAALLAEGYKLQFVQQAVPEPSGLIALGGCLAGLAGFIRRRK